MYTCLAGFMETGETIEETVHREVAEEVGLSLSSFRVVDSQHWPFPDNNLMIGCFATAASADEPSIDEKELRDARWFSVEQLEEAVARIEENPIISLVSPGRMDGNVFVPPSGTLANRLIKRWLQERRC
ncbi:unnamed protein product [Cyprideis torosa]|uniref:NAD(+) diphosphatase n=1 Tax=Cyprideis torosa TaxID=163714 RepID=A0A7R8WVE3_9CRUS|nr:unnamed protein product [Cyprideis torosa]CAG0910112.1 unnamed protein product [Cyprideis torosa]